MAFRPITITKNGDQLTSPQAVELDDQMTIGYFGDKSTYPGVRIAIVGRHNFCGGEFLFIRKNQEIRTLYCPVCDLKVFFPKRIKKYGELRIYFRENL